MTTLVISDVHANLEALEAVLEHAPHCDTVWFLGDAVGYGPDPNAVVDRLSDLQPEVWLAGNHDHAALGLLGLSDFNAHAREAAEWTTTQLTESSAARLGAAEPDDRCKGIRLVHGSPRRPIWEYIVDAHAAVESFAHFVESICFFGHTHVPAVYQEELDGALRLVTLAGQSLERHDCRWLANPGSVGQPRDGDPRAGYMLFEPGPDKLTFHRVAYDIAAVQTKMLKAGLPSRLAARLDYGM